MWSDSAYAGAFWDTLCEKPMAFRAYSGPEIQDCMRKIKMLQRFVGSGSGMCF